jgi:bifunctional non-homologous end joining protein LigD
MQARSTYLYFTEGSSDKVYNVHLRPEGAGWIVAFENGRRGGTLKSGLKTATPLPFAEAEAVFAKTVKDKMKGGYTEQESGTAYAGTTTAGEVTGFQPKLLNPITPEEAVALHNVWGMVGCQIKRDGERRGVLVVDGQIRAANRSGLAVACQEHVMAAVSRICLEKGAVLDGEDVGGRIYVFDLLAWNGVSITDQPLHARAVALGELADWVAAEGLGDVVGVDEPVWANTSADIARFLAEARIAQEEGVVFLDGDAPYIPGRPNSGGRALKVKFIESATVRVCAQTPGKRSVSMEVQDGGIWRGVGSVTIPANATIPDVGALVEVEYLYAYPKGSLFQPVYKGPRTDVGVEAARESQLKYKAGTT